MHFALNNKEISNHSKTDESVTISGSVKKIGIYAFSGNNNIKSVILEDGVEEIDRYAFGNCTSLESITIPGNVKRIGAFAFDGCTNLKSVTIENGVEEIDNRAFNNCTSLTAITPESIVYRILGE